VEEKYGNLFQMYEKITADDPYNSNENLSSSLYNGWSLG
jgi:hypothetical protein